MTAADIEAAGQPEQPDDWQEVDVDLDAQDEALRKESVGAPSKVRLRGRVIHIVHAGEWSSRAMRAASGADWDAWAREVIPDEDELEFWLDANLKNYQIEAVFDECGRQARMSLGKRQRHTASRRDTRRR